MNLRRSIAAAACLFAFAVAAPALASEVREPRAHVGFNVPDAWVTNIHDHWVNSGPTDKSFHIWLRAVDHAAWKVEKEVEAGLITDVVEHLSDVTVDKHAKAIKWGGFEGWEVFGQGKRKSDGEKVSFFLLLLRDVKLPAKGIVALGMGTKEGFQKHHKGIYDELHSLHVTAGGPAGTVELIEPKAHMIVDVPEAWDTVTTNEWITSGPSDHSFHVVMKAMDHASWKNEKEAEQGLLADVVEHLKDVTVDTHAKKVTQKGYEGWEIAGHGKRKSDGKDVKFFLVLLRDAKAPTKGLVVLGMGTKEGYEKHQGGIHETLSSIRTY
jgi:hypothetical protein